MTNHKNSSIYYTIDSIERIMKLVNLNNFKSVLFSRNAEWGYIVLLILYMVFLGNQIPISIAWFFLSSLGTILLLLIMVVLFVYSRNILLPITYAIFAWYLIHTCEQKTKNIGNAMIQFTPAEDRRTKYMQDMNPPKTKTLEEEVVGNVSPKTGTQYLESEYRPVAEDIHNAMNV